MGSEANECEMIFIWNYIIQGSILPAIDTCRQKKTFGKVGNINHWVSYLFSAVSVVALFIAYGLPLWNWHTILFILACAFERGIIYDISMNVLVNLFVQPRALNYVSIKSNALNESRLTHIGFWWRRFWYILLTGITITAYYLL